MSLLRQICAVTSINFRALPHRLGSSLVVIIGTASTVAIVIAILAVTKGITATLTNAGRPDRVIIVQQGHDSERDSTLSREEVSTILDTPHVKIGVDAKPIGSAECLTVIRTFKKSDSSDANITLRGVGSKVRDIRPEIELAGGRMFRPGLRELIVGIGAQEEFRGFAIGDQIDLRGTQWTIVGTFQSHGSTTESELLGDAETVLSVLRQNVFQDVVVLLDSPQSFDAFRDALTHNPVVSVDVMREAEYAELQNKFLEETVSAAGLLVGAIMAFGAVFAALNTMHSAVSSRTLEIATLRALGFGAGPVVVSVFAEALLLSIVGAATGASIAWLLLYGRAFSTSALGLSQLVIPVAMNPALTVTGISGATLLGWLGSLVPAIRAARMPIATAIQPV